MTRLTATLREVTRISGSLGAATITTFGDATAEAADITLGETAYIATGKVTGTNTNNADTTDATATDADILLGQTAYIADGTKATGVYVPLDTSDANAIEGDIQNGKTAYVNAVKLTGTNTNNADTTDATATADSLLYGHTAYGAAGTKLTGTGAWWQEVTLNGGLFQSSSSMPATFTLYIPKALQLVSLFYWVDSIVTLSVTHGNVTNLNSTYRQTTALQTLTFTGSTASCTTFTNMFAGSSVVTINGTLDLTSATNVATMFNAATNIVIITFAASTIKIALSLSSSPNLSTTSLLSLANGLDAAAAPKTLTLHATSKTNMDAIMVDNVGGVAILGSTMTLTAFVTGVKGWTIA